MNTKMKEMIEIATLAFPDESERECKEIAKGLCKSHKVVFKHVMLEIERAVEQEYNHLQIEVTDIDDLVRERMSSYTWDWAILNTREHLIKVMTRFGYVISVDSGLLIITWDWRKHHDFSKES